MLPTITPHLFVLDRMVAVPARGLLTISARLLHAVAATGVQLTVTDRRDPVRRIGPGTIVRKPDVLTLTYPILDDVQLSECVVLELSRGIIASNTVCRGCGDFMPTSPRGGEGGFPCRSAVSPFVR